MESAIGNKEGLLSEEDKNKLLTQQDFKCPEYTQQFGEFIPNLSVLDFMLNGGK